MGRGDGGWPWGSAGEKRGARQNAIKMMGVRHEARQLMLRQAEGAMHRVNGVGRRGPRRVRLLPAARNGDAPKPCGRTDFNVG